MLTVRKTTLVIFLLTFCLVKTYSQNNPYNEVSIASPTAASLGKYADIPVSAHTGIPQISLPIYTIKEGPLSIPISLSYHAGGLKVWETASWVGAGWSLNAGGVITRTVMGAPDERMTSNVASQTHGYLSDSGYSNALYIPLTTGYPYQPSPGSRGYFVNDWKEFAAGRKDGEPDMFFFNVGGYSGKFFFRDDGKPVMLPEQDIRVEYDYTPGFNQSISSFILTMPDGTKYFFGRTPDLSDIDPIERTNPMNDQAGLSQGQVISSWFLNKVQSADGIFSLSLTYVAESYSFYTISTFPINFNTTALEYSLVKNMVTGVRLNKISSSNATVEFQSNTVRLDLNGTSASFTDDANTQAKALDVIRVYDSANITGKKYLLNYDYFYDGSTPMPGWFANQPGYSGFSVDRRRLRLLSVQEQSLDGTVSIPPTQFEYFTEPVPRRLYFGVDHWGFNNGKNSNTSLIPTYYFAANADSVAGANRNASWPEMRAGTLRKITYPTKGSAEYVFENNDTWVSYQRKQWVNQFGLSGGQDGSMNWFETIQAFSGEPYKVVFSNTGTVGPQAQLEIYRTSDNVQMGAWVLEPQQSITFIITYPAGSYRIRTRKNNVEYTGYGAVSSFDQSTNVLIQRNEVIGGLRVKTTILRDAIDEQNSIITNYSYLVNGKSSGYLYARPNYLYKQRNDVLGITGLPTGSLCPNAMQGEAGCRVCGSAIDLKSGSSIRVLGSSQGNHIGYNEVRISQASNGYKILRFFGSERWDTDVSDVAFRTVPASGDCVSSIPNYPNAPLPFEYQRGELKYEGVFNNSGTIVSERSYVMNFAEDPIATPAIIFQSVPQYTGGNPSLPSHSMDLTLYSIKTKKKISVEETLNTYSQSSGMMQAINTTYFESNFHSSPTRILTSTSQNGILEKKFKYSFDYRISACDQVANPEAVYFSDTSVARTTFNSTWTPAVFTPYEGAINYRYWSWQYYVWDMCAARIKYVRAMRQNFTGTNNACSTCVANAKNTADGNLKPILELQQRNMNVPIEVSEWRGAKLLSASYNNYLYASSPSGFVYPGSIESISLASPATSFTVSNVSGNTVVKDNRYRLESSALFTNGNIVEITPKSGVKTSYLWGYKNTLPIAKAVGTDFNTLAIAFASAGYNLSQLRNQSSMSSALVNVYSYHPFFGMTSETDANGKTLSYSYDKLQRLIIVRDQNNNIVKRICYGYAGQPGDCNLFYNTELSVPFARNNCGAGFTGTTVNYIVPAGTYASTISVADANLMAQNDANTNGQAFANVNGTCVGSSITVQGYNSKSFNYKVRFTNNSTGAFYIFDLTAGTFNYSTLGQVPAGIYTVDFYPVTKPTTATFVVNGFVQTGSSVSFYNITVSSLTNAYMY